MRRRRSSLITNCHVEQRHSILDRLQREADQDQANSENTHAFFWQMIGRPFDEGSTRACDCRDDAYRESRL